MRAPIAWLNMINVLNVRARLGGNAEVQQATQSFVYSTSSPLTHCHDFLTTSSEWLLSALYAHLSISTPLTAYYHPVNKVKTRDTMGVARTVCS